MSTRVVSGQSNPCGASAQRTKPIALDLFCGCGGLTLGLRWAGFRVCGAVELDPLAVETYRANHPSVFVWETDIRDLGVADVLDTLGIRPGQLDLLAGGPPCQGFSRISTLNGSVKRNDPRNDLVLEFIRFVRGLRPKAVMLENVPPVADDPRMHSLVAALRRMGYHCTSAVLDAADFGVPQRRRRFILLAGWRRIITFGRKSDCKRTVRDALRALPARADGDPLHTLPERHTERIWQLIRSIPRNGGGRTDLRPDQQLPRHRRCNGFSDVYGRMAWEAVAPTITGGCCDPSKGRFLHPDEDRAITLREAALLQSFPPTYYFSLRRGKFAAARMIGNAVPPEFAKRLALSIRAALCGPVATREGASHGRRTRPPAR